MESQITKFLPAALHPDVGFTQPRLQAGGSLREAALYIERPADVEFYQALGSGKLCYILAPRQMGKSSLCSRTARRLRQTGVRCIHLDCLMLGGHESTPDSERWYYSLFKELSAKLEFPSSWLDAFWQRHQRETPAYRWALFLRDQILANVSTRIVLLFDEIDSLLSLRFVADGFFAGVRDAFNARGEHADYRRLNFGFIGVASPGELMSSMAGTPLNVSLSIRLEDFSGEEAYKFVPILSQVSQQPLQLLEEVLSWTSGHPYMTHKICGELANRLGAHPGHVEPIVRELFLDGEDATLKSVEKRFQRCPSGGHGEPDPGVASQLRLYRRVLEGHIVTADRHDPVQNELRLSGMCRWEAERLLVRNRIYASVFSMEWIHSNESKRQLDDRLDAWVYSGKDTKFLLDGTELRSVQLWAKERADLLSEEHQFLQASLESARHRQEQRTRRVVRLAGVFTGALLVLITLLQMHDLKQKITQAKTEAAAEKTKADNVQYRLIKLDIELKQAKAARDADLAAQEIERQKILRILATNKLNHIRTAVGLFGRPPSLAERPIDALEIGLRAIEQTVKAGESLHGTALNDLITVLPLAVYSTRLDHDGEVVATAVSPQGDRIATAGKKVNDGAQVYVWALGPEGSAKLVTQLSGHTGTINALAFSPDGRYLASASDDGTICLRRARDGQLVRTFVVGNVIVNAVAFSPNSLELASGSNDGTASLWSIDSYLPVREFRGHRAAVVAVAFSKDGTRLATASSDMTARVWEISTGRSLAILAGHTKGLVSIGYSHGGGRILTASLDGTVRFWGPNGSGKGTFAQSDSRLTSATFSPDDEEILTTAEDGVASVFNTKTGVLKRRLSGHTSAVRSGVFLGDSRILTASADHTARIWQIGVPQAILQLPIHDGRINSVAFAHGGGERLLTLADQAARLWEPRTGRLLQTLNGHTGKVLAGAFTANGSHFATAGDDDTVRLWDGKSGAPLQRVAGFGTALRSVAISPDAKYVFAADGGSSLVVWPVASPNDRFRFESGAAPILATAVSADGRFLVTGHSDRMARLWELKLPSGMSTSQAPTWQNILTYREHEREVRAVAFSPNGWNVITGSGDWQARIFSRAGEFRATLSHHSEPISAVSYSPDDRLVVTASEDRSACLWRASTGERVLAMKYDRAAATTASFSSDSARVAIGYEDGAVRIYPTAAEQYVGYACKILNEYPEKFKRVRNLCQNFLD